MTDRQTRTPLQSQQLPSPSDCACFRGCTLLFPGKRRSAGSSPGLPRLRRRRGWEEKVAAVAQSARASATRDGLPVGQSQLRAPDQALGERTNKCSRAQIPALGVTTGGDSGRPRTAPGPPASARRGAQSPLPSAPSRGAARPASHQTFPPWARDPGLWALPARPFPRFNLEPLFGLGASNPLPVSLLSLQSFWGGALHVRGSCRGSPAPLSSFCFAFTWI